MSPLRPAAGSGQRTSRRIVRRTHRRSTVEPLETRALLAAGSALTLLDGVGVEQNPPGSSNVSFQVVRGGDTTTAITFNYQTADGSAHAGSDYQAQTGSATIPAGAGNVFVTVPIVADLLHEPLEQFNFNLTGIVSVVGNAPSFFGHVDFPTGQNSLSVAAGDFNLDGKPDLAVVNRQDNNISVLLNTTAPGSATASFAPAVDFLVGNLPFGVAVADVNRDGRPDIASANFTDNTASILLNTTAAGAGPPSFAAKVDFPMSMVPDSIALGDLTGDGAPELVVTDFVDNTVSVLVNTTPAGATTPSFGARQNLQTGKGPRSVMIRDLNNDGVADLVTANLRADTVSVLLVNTIAGAAGLVFMPKVDFDTGSGPTAVAVGDVNGDGKPDLAVSNGGTPSVPANTLTVLLNTTPSGSLTASFAARQDFGTGLNPYSIALADVTGDGVPDLATANNGSAQAPSAAASVLRNTTSPGSMTVTLDAHVDVPTGLSPSGIVAADVNGDGRLDLATANQGDSTASVLLNTRVDVLDGQSQGVIVDNDPSIRGRFVFYNESKFDANSALPGAADDAAIAPDKSALLPGGIATFANYTNYSKGINGVMVDVSGAGGVLTAADFEFRVGNDNNVASWLPAPPPTIVTVRQGAGVAGSDRVTIIWPNGAVKKQWLQVILLANATTGLASPERFYFGNAIGEIGDSLNNAQVNSGDEIQIRVHPRNLGNPAPIDFIYDISRDGQVNATDQIQARTNTTNLASALRLIAPPAVAGPTVGALEPALLAAAAEGVGENLLAGRAGRRRLM